MEPGSALWRTLRALKPTEPGRAVLLLAWSVWVWWAVLPEWSGRRADPQRTIDRTRLRLDYEASYGAGWLTRHLRSQGRLPTDIPANPSAAGNRKVIPYCPSPGDPLISNLADWAICEREKKVRALARDHSLEIPDGGWSTESLFPDIPPLIGPPLPADPGTPAHGNP